MFCPSCGAKTQYNYRLNQDNKDFDAPRKVIGKSKRLANIGFRIGLISFILSFIPFIGIISLYVAPAGIIICAIAKKQDISSTKAIVGLKFSIWGTILGIVLYFVNIIILAMLGVIK